MSETNQNDNKLSIWITRVSNFCWLVALLLGYYFAGVSFNFDSIFKYVFFSFWISMITAIFTGSILGDTRGGNIKTQNPPLVYILYGFAILGLCTLVVFMRGNAVFDEDGELIRTIGRNEQIANIQKYFLAFITPGVFGVQIALKDPSKH